MSFNGDGGAAALYAVLSILQNMTLRYCERRNIFRFKFSRAKGKKDLQNYKRKLHVVCNDNKEASYGFTTAPVI